MGGIRDMNLCSKWSSSARSSTDGFSLEAFGSSGCYTNMKHCYVPAHTHTGTHTGTHTDTHNTKGGVHGEIIYEKIKKRMRFRMCSIHISGSGLGARVVKSCSFEAGHSHVPCQSRCQGYRPGASVERVEHVCIQTHTISLSHSPPHTTT